MAVTRSAMAPPALNVSRYRPSASTVARMPVPATDTWAAGMAFAVPSITRPDTDCPWAAPGVSAQNSRAPAAAPSRWTWRDRLVGVLTRFIVVVRVPRSGNGEGGPGGPPQSPDGP